jgi:tetratricopeptide (TPR) repeat protein
MEPAARLLSQAIAPHRAGRFEEAAAAYRRVLLGYPEHPIAWGNLGIALATLGDLAAAARCQAISLRLDPGDAIAWFNAANLHEKRGMGPESRSAFRRALLLDPAVAAAWLNYAIAELGDNEPGKAAAALRRLLRLRPDSVPGRFALAKATRDQFDGALGARLMRDGLALAPADTAGWHLLASQHRGRGDFEAALRFIDRALCLDPSNAGFQSFRLFVLAAGARWPAETVLAEHRAWGLQAAPARPAPTRARRLLGAGPLSVGFVSGDFYRHSVAHFLLPLLENYDRRRLSIRLYSESPLEDDVTRRLAGLADGLCRIRGMGDEAVDARIRDDRIDILVDLSGHTPGNRLAVFARRPAPLQVTWLGYPHSTGLPAIDVRLVDAVTDPPQAGDRLATERLVRMRDGFHCYAPLDEAPPTDRGPGAELVFGCFNDVYKVNEAVIGLWSEILSRVPGSRLLLKSRLLADAVEQRRLQAGFAAHGIDAARIRLLGWARNQREHLALYREMDLALDTFPYNGTTTTCDALWMGVPVVTLAGHGHMARVGASLLAQAGLTDLVADDAEGYVETAVALMGDRARLDRLRRDLRPRFKASPLGDGRGFARRFEAALLEAWEAA